MVAEWNCIPTRQQKPTPDIMDANINIRLHTPTNN